MFRTWHLAVPRDVEVYGIQFPGRSHRSSQRPFTRVRDFIEELGPELVQALDKPFALFGHSLGAIVAFEVARWLRAHCGILPDHLFVSGHRAPQILSSKPPSYRMSDADLLRSISTVNGMARKILQNTEMMRIMLPVLRADYEMAETYQYDAQDPLACPITAFGGTEEEETADGKLEAWMAQTSNVYLSYRLIGDHFFIHSPDKSFLTLFCKELGRIPRYSNLNGRLQ